MGKRKSKKNKDNDLFEQEEKVERIKEVNEADVAYAVSLTAKKNVPEDNVISMKQSFKGKIETNATKANYLASSVNFLSYLAVSFEIKNLKVIPFIETYFIVSALKTVNSQKTIDDLLSKYLPDHFTNDKKLKELAIVFFNAITEEKSSKSLSADSKKINSLLKKLIVGIEEIKKGKRAIQIVLDLLSKSKETKKFVELSKYLRENNTNELSQLNEIADKLIALLGSSKHDDKYLQNWKVMIGSYIWVLRYSTQNVEVLIDDLLKKKSSQFKELHIVLIGIFATKLFHSTPDWKPIGLSYQLLEKMKVLQPTAEVFYNPDVIISLSSDPNKQEEYFWTYVWGKPYSIFEKPKMKKIIKTRKKIIDVDEEVIVEEKNYGDFIKVYGEAMPTGVIRIKSNY